MTTAYVKELTDAGSATGNVTQLYPASCTAGTGATTAGTERRRPTQGVLYRLEVYAKDGGGGVIEIFDVAGESTGATNNVDTGETMTNAYVAAKVAAFEGRKIWTQQIAGSAGGYKVNIGLPVPIMHGLAARWIADSAGDDIDLNIEVDGTFYKHTIAGE